jgi:hypothetical protein
VQTVREKLQEHMSVAQREIVRGSSRNEHNNSRCSRRFNGEYCTNNNVGAARQEMAELREQISNNVTDEVKTVSDKVTECRNQILAEKESNLLKFQKVNQEIEILKVRLAS